MSVHDCTSQLAAMRETLRNWGNRSARRNTQHTRNRSSHPSAGFDSRSGISPHVVIRAAVGRARRTAVLYAFLQGRSMIRGTDRAFRRGRVLVAFCLLTFAAEARSQTPDPDDDWGPTASRNSSVPLSGVARRRNRPSDEAPQASQKPARIERFRNALWPFKRSKPGGDPPARLRAPDFELRARARETH